MVLIFEASRPFQLKPFRFKSRIMTRVGWLWFAVTRLKVSFKEFSEKGYDWTEYDSSWRQWDYSKEILRAVRRDLRSQLARENDHENH
jgi:hypothetical protein